MKTLSGIGVAPAGEPCTHHNALVVREALLSAKDKAHVVLYCYLCESAVEVHVSELCGCRAAYIEQLLPNQLDWNQVNN